MAQIADNGRLESTALTPRSDDGSQMDGQRGPLGLPDGAPANAVLEAIGTCRATRRFRSELVDPVLIDTLLWAATRASSPNNTQLWHFVVVRDPDVRSRFGAAVARMTRWIDSLPEPDDVRDGRIRRDARDLIANIADVPVLVVVCAEHAYPVGAPEERYLWSCTNTAAQNLLIAARSLGLGAALTMMHVTNERAVETLLDLPDGVRIGAVVAVGHPATDFGPVSRRPLAEVVHHDRW